MTDHLSFDRLSELADEGLAPAVASAAHAHLRGCEECASRMASFSALRESAAALPREVAPPEDLWPAIHGAMTPRGTATRRTRWTGRRFAAAGILIAVASSALTYAAIVGGRTRPEVAVATAPSGAMAADPTPPAVPARFAAAERRYVESVAELQRTLDQRRASLAPETIAIVERSLRVSDAAIAEAREALARDPGNRALTVLIASNYERKIDLLRRATELAELK